MLTKTLVWLFCHKVEVVAMIRFKFNVDDMFSNASDFVVRPASFKLVINWHKRVFFVKLLAIVAFILRLHPRLCHYRELTRKVIKTSELKKAKSKNLLLSQKIAFRSRFKLFNSKKHSKNRSPIDTLSSFIVHGSFFWSTSSICSVSEIHFRTKHPIILDGWWLSPLYNFFALSEHQSIDTFPHLV